MNFKEIQELYANRGIENSKAIETLRQQLSTLINFCTDCATKIDDESIQDIICSNEDKISFHINAFEENVECTFKEILLYVTKLPANIKYIIDRIMMRYNVSIIRIDLLFDGNTVFVTNDKVNHSICFEKHFKLAIDGISMECIR